MKNTINQRVDELENKLKEHEMYFDVVAKGVNDSAKTEIANINQQLADHEDNFEFVSDELINLYSKIDNLEKIANEYSSSKQKDKEFAKTSIWISIGALLMLLLFAIAGKF